MSRWTLPYKAGVVMALAAFVIGITAANAMAWPGGEPVPAPTTPQHGKDKDKDKGHKDDDDQDEGKGGHEKPKPQPQPTTPQSQPSPPVTPPAETPPAPVVSQGAPAPPPEQPIETEAVPPEQGGVPESPVVAQAPPAEEAATSPAANRSELAKTGLDPALIALLGAMCLGGGTLLFRRALARN